MHYTRLQSFFKVPLDNGCAKHMLPAGLTNGGKR